jgi:hypothetical protein
MTDVSKVWIRHTRKDAAPTPPQQQLLPCLALAERVPLRFDDPHWSNLLQPWPRGCEFAVVDKIWISESKFNISWVKHGHQKASVSKGEGIVGVRGLGWTNTMVDTMVKTPKSI